MRIFRLCQVAVWLAVLSLPASAADLNKVDRNIAKEPAYKTKSPKYCLLVFGLNAQTRVWLVLDGDVLYVDGNGNGDLTEAGETVKSKGDQFDAVAITAKDGVTPDTRVELQLSGELTFVYCHSKDRPWQRAVVDRAGNLQLAATRQAAPVIHFNGPLTLAPRFEQPFNRGAATDLEVMVGTSGLGIGTFARLANGDVAKNLYPVAEIVFPTGGGQPEKLRVVLDQRC
jgi:hypothetical protein